MSADPVSELASFRTHNVDRPGARRHPVSRRPGRDPVGASGEHRAEPDVTRLEMLLAAVAAAAGPRRR